MGMRLFYSNADLAGDLDVQVYIDVDAQNPALRAQQALQELQNGAITPDEYKARIHGKEKNTTDKRDIAIAHGENAAFLRGEIVDNRRTIAIDNHPAHLPVIVQLIQSDDFKNLSPEVQEAAFAHAYIHMYAISQPQAVFQNVVLPVATQLGVAPPQLPVAGPQPVAAESNPPQSNAGVQ
jgi:hypothetical protein